MLFACKQTSNSPHIATDVSDTLEIKQLVLDTMNSMPNKLISITKVDKKASISDRIDTEIETEPTLEAVESLSNNYGKCLDKGTNMLLCTKEYIYQIVSLSDRQYAILLSNLTWVQIKTSHKICNLA